LLLALAFWGFTLGFLVWEAFGRKRIIEGKMLKGKGKQLLKGKC
jgi:hypothetical protein